MPARWCGTPTERWRAASIRAEMVRSQDFERWKLHPIWVTVLPKDGGQRMYAIVYKTDGFPICRQVEGVSPDPVVTWTSESDAKAFITSKGGEADFQALAITDESMDQIAKAMGCPVESLTFDPYPG